MLLFVALVVAADPRVLVLDVEGEASVAVSASKLVTKELERSRRFDVVTSEDMRRALSLEADRQEAGCDTSSCLEEIAGAMGAQLVVFGDITVLGDATLLTLNLFDTAAVRSIARTSAEIDDTTLATVGPRLVRQLVREYDAFRGALPAGTVPILAGAAGALGGAALLVVGGWQLALLDDDRAGHDRLVEDFERDGDTSLVARAEDVRRSADEHARNATAALACGALLSTAGLAAVGYGLWSELE